MARYVWKEGEFRDRLTGEPMESPYAGQIVCPTIISDIPEYHSPIDGRLITSRSARRDDLKRNNCVEYEPSLSPTKGKFRKEKYARLVGKKAEEAA